MAWSRSANHQHRRSSRDRRDHPPTIVLVLILTLLAGCSSGPWSSRSDLAFSQRAYGEGEPDPTQTVPSSPLERATRAYKQTKHQPVNVGSSLWAGTVGRIREGWEQLAGSWRMEGQAPDAVEPLMPDGEAKLHLAAAAVCEAQGNLEQALSHYSQALDAVPNHKEALVGRARLYHRKGLLNVAIQHYHQALDAYPDDPLVRSDLGLCYARRGDLQQALHSLSAAVRRRPKDLRYRNNLATVLVQRGEVEQAIEALEPLVGPAVAHYNVGQFLHQLERPGEALAHFQHANQLDPTLVEAAQMARQLAAYDRTENR